MPTDPILDAFDQRRRRPGDLMVVASRQQASVDDVDCLARAAGRQLARAAPAPGSVVGLAAANGPGFLAALVALRRAACAALLFDARTPPAESERVAAALGAAAMLTCRRAWPRGESDFVVSPVAAGRPAAVLPPEIAVVKLTSGSTGEPRGILTPSAALVADDRALAVTMGLADDERILAAIPLSHSYGLSSAALPALMRRSLLIVPESRSPLAPMRLAREKEATFLPTVPAYLQGLLRMASPPRAPASLRLVVTAGAPLKPSTAVRFREVYERPVHVFYGASECGGITFDRDGGAGERGTLGRPVEGVEVTLERAPGDERGTVTVASAAVAAGYHPEPDPRLDGGRFRTSDVGCWQDGELAIEGRLDDLINVRGKKVNPREVDAVVGQLAGVDEVVTVGVVLPGQDETIVRSFVACRPGSLSFETVQAWCRRHLAEHKVPRSIVLVEEIPRTARGKLDRDALLALEPHGRPIASPNV